MRCLLDLLGRGKFLSLLQELLKEEKKNSFPKMNHLKMQDLGLLQPFCNLEGKFSGELWREAFT